MESAKVSKTSKKSKKSNELKLSKVVSDVVSDVVSEDVKNSEMIAEVVEKVVEEKEVVVPKTKKPRKTNVEKLNELLDAILEAESVHTEDTIKELCKKFKVNGTKYSVEKKKREPTAWNTFMKEYTLKCKSEKKKVDFGERKIAWNAAKSDPNSKYYVDPEKKAVKTNKYEGLKPGDAIPDQPGKIMGNNKKPVSKKGAAGMKVLEELGRADESESEEEAVESDSSSDDASEAEEVSDKDSEKSESGSESEEEEGSGSESGGETEED
jgi:hypothetical protein